MTVAAIIVAEDAAAALAPADGRAAARRCAETAWAGGAVPIVVVAPDPDGAVARSLSGASATLAEPPPTGDDPLAAARRGAAVATELVGETDALLVWPVAHPWVDAETITSLIQAHGVDPAAILAPGWNGTRGWPVLVPAGHLSMLSAGAIGGLPEALLGGATAAGLRVGVLDLGDPGATLDGTTPLGELPRYEGPAGPVSQPPDWGAAAADRADDTPPDGPAIVPFASMTQGSEG